MNKLEKLYKRLLDLEAEYSKLLAEEFRKQARSTSSIYLTRKRPYILDGKAFQSAEVGHIEKLEKNIVALRKKLGQSLKEGPISILREYITRREQLTDLLGGRKALAREMLEKIDR